MPVFSVADRRSTGQRRSLRGLCRPNWMCASSRVKSLLMLHAFSAIQKAKGFVDDLHAFKARSDRDDNFMACRQSIPTGVCLGRCQHGCSSKQSVKEWPSGLGRYPVRQALAGCLRRLGPCACRTLCVMRNEQSGSSGDSGRPMQKSGSHDCGGQPDGPTLCALGVHRQLAASRPVRMWSASLSGTPKVGRAVTSTVRRLRSNPLERTIQEKNARY